MTARNELPVLNYRRELYRSRAGSNRMSGWYLVGLLGWACFSASTNMAAQSTAPVPDKPELPDTPPRASESAEELVKMTIVFRGAAEDEDVELLTSALRKAEGVRVHSDDVGLGFRRFSNRFSTPIEVSLPRVPGDKDVNVGQLAKILSQVRTPHRRQHPPGANLILFTDDTLSEESISALRSALSQVNGVEVNRPGGLGASLQEGWCWIRLEDAGGAMLLEIEQKAAQAGVRLRRVQSP